MIERRRGCVYAPFVGLALALTAVVACASGPPRGMGTFRAADLKAWRSYPIQNLTFDPIPPSR